jgi:hypothetical protein
MVDYAWTFSNCKVIQKMGDLENVIKSVDWTLTATDATHSVSASGTTEFSGVDLLQFVDFTSITKDQMTDWVLSGISDEDLKAVKEQLENSLNELNKPVLVQMPLPFN